ncbi:PTS sugar transporter subunit IIC [Vibrio sp. S11_S32]|uniref:PTS sugar transporter subunit IIC n=1 Tax=Vibrio sp. S11_S32 TaxID=2720225 RepID=UPI00168140DC|nr:PTS transporter subunit EIIC [Vibrio sp. S11_S32]MBD1574864.1 PTS sugar transporter subunit IIC [Vibrio sp. S11_S32]
MDQQTNRLLMKRVERHISPIANWLASSKHLIAIRDGFQISMPFIVVGSLFVPFIFPPFNPSNYPSINAFLLEYRAFFSTMFEHTMGLIALFIAFGASASLAKQYGIPERLSGLTGCVAFLLLTGTIEHASPGSYLGGNGLFTAIISSIYSIEVIRFFYRKGWYFDMPEEVPLITRNGFKLILPLLFIMLSLAIINLTLKHYTGLYFPQLITDIFKPLVIASDTLTAVLLSLLLCQLLWFMGIHGSLIVTGIMNPFWLSGLIANQTALAAGAPVPHIYLQGFWDYYLLIGGVGSTLPLVFMALKSRSKQLSSVGKIGLIPSMFNINEPILFGFPIIMNPMFFLPFVCVPLINATLAWHFTQLGLLDPFISMLPWSMPAPIGASLSANGSWHNILMVLFAMFNSWMIYRPFFKVYEKQLISQETHSSS